jgi:hypothetical protein
MGQATPTAKHLAILVLSDELSHDSMPDGLQCAVQRTFIKLKMHLSARFGAEGYHTLLRRAVVLSAFDISWLASIRVTDDGVVEGFRYVSGYKPVFDGCIAILVHLIALLETFIGTTLTVRMFSSVWPKVTLDDSAPEWGNAATGLSFDIVRPDTSSGLTPNAPEDSKAGG